MGRHYGHGRVSSKRIVKRAKYPQVTIDRENDFLSVKLASGVETKSYLKRGFLFCEDKNGRVIEIQLINLSDLGKTKKKKAA